MRVNKVGFIGLGSQGAPMAKRIIDAGFDVVLWARRAASLQPFADTNARYADSVRTLAEQVDVCAICVVDDAGVQQLVDQLIPWMSPGNCIVVHSTVHPSLCKQLSRRAGDRGIALIDAPVSGGGGSAAEGRLTVMVGGDSAVVESLKPLFKTFAGLIVHLGDVGAGQVAKLVNNNMMVANLAVAHLAMQVSQKLGICEEAFKELIGVSSGRSFSFEVRSRMKQPADFEHGARLLDKDVRLLGDTVGDDLDYQALRDVANSFLTLALAKH